MTTTNDSAPDLDAIEARARRTAERTERYLDALGDGGDPDEIDDAIREQGGANDTLALVVRVRDLTAKLDALVADVRRAAGETHEPPADVAALLARVAAARREGAEAMRDRCVSLALLHGLALREATSDARRADRDGAARSFDVAASAVKALATELARVTTVDEGEAAQ